MVHFKKWLVVGPMEQGCSIDPQFIFPCLLKKFIAQKRDQQRFTVNNLNKVFYDVKKANIELETSSKQ